MGKRILSFIVIVSLCASTIVGALGLSLRFAKSDTINNSSEFSIVDFWAALDEFSFVPSGVKTDLYNFVNPKVTDNDNSSYLVFICHDSGTDNWALTVFQADYYYWWYGYDNTHLSTNGNQIPWLRMSVLGYFNTNGTSYTVSYYGTVSNDTKYVCYAFNFSTLRSVEYEFAVPGIGNENVSGRLNWISRTIIAGNTGVSSNKNLYSSPRVFMYDILVFWLGSRRYITIKDQSIIRQLNGGGLMEYVWAIESPFDEQGDFELLSYQYSDLILLQYSGVESQLSNISPNGVYAVDITDLKWTTIQDSVIYDFVNPSSPTLIGMSNNVPYILEEVAPEPGTNGTPDSYTQLWNEYNIYVNNYNTSPVIPDQLSSALFGVNGLWSYPVSVASPHQSLNVWKWWTLEENLGINFELMDVVMVHAGAAEYTLVYYYDHSLQVAFMPVQNLHLNELFDKFDCVIIVPDDQGELDKSTWWQSILSFLADELNLQFDFSILDNYAVSGSSSGGVQYVDSRPGNATVVLNGYIYLTPKGVLRQQLYNFSDGITKFYKLMSDYVESEDSWKTSFLQWTASWFSAINTLNGSINGLAAAISKLDLSRIEDKLDRLIENTNEDESNFWYIPLWNFVKQFEPAAEDFVEGLQVYDDNWDNLPLLSPVPTIPLLPTISLGGG